MSMSCHAWLSGVAWKNYSLTALSIDISISYDLINSLARCVLFESIKMPKSLGKKASCNIFHQTIINWVLWGKQRGGGEGNENLYSMWAKYILRITCSSQLDN